ncbi:Threonine dehydratase mitochondrial [Bienertia sinuspersici]
MQLTVMLVVMMEVRVAQCAMTLRFWNCGVFKKRAKGLQYIGGQGKTVQVDADMSLDKGLRRVFNDAEVLEMTEIAKENRSIELYVNFPKDLVDGHEPEDYYDWFNDRPDNPIPYKELVSDVDDSDGPGYNPEDEEDEDKKETEDELDEDYVSVLEVEEEEFRAPEGEGEPVSDYEESKDDIHTPEESENEDGQMRAKRSRLCWGETCSFPPATEKDIKGWRRGWIEDYGTLLCTDACFLKTFLGGQLMSAIRRDLNEQIYPVAWGVVEGENICSREWFFLEIQKCLNLGDGAGQTILSDEHQLRLTAFLTTTMQWTSQDKKIQAATESFRGERYWPKVDFPLEPPLIKVGPGRPIKNRRKDPFENPKKPGKLTKHGVEMRVIRGGVGSRGVSRRGRKTGPAAVSRGGRGATDAATAGRGEVVSTGHRGFGVCKGGRGGSSTRGRGRGAPKGVVY